MAKKDENAESFEKTFARLQEIVRELESGNVSLDKGMTLFKEGVVCSNACKNMLDQARIQLSKWQDGEQLPCVNLENALEEGKELSYKN